ncbi:AAA family ATPase [Actinoplanes sp. NPDC049118]|uniref:AAA family ATPase n=1 Tax=Actinoplanes sp. NPDC049118 TaxID=3155769 RepID=UPI003411191A
MLAIVGFSTTLLRATGAVEYSRLIAAALSAPILSLLLGRIVRDRPVRDILTARIAEAKRIPRRLRRRSAARPRDYLVPWEVAPVPPTFVGRAEERRRLVEFLTSRNPSFEVPVAVIVGPYGIGKTALASVVATELAGQYAGGKLFADLSRRQGTAGAERGDDEIVHDALGAFITGLRQPGDPVEPSTAGRVRQYHRLSRRYQAVIVLDDADDIGVVRRLLPAGPRCAVIVTTSDPALAQRPEWFAVTLEPLAVEQSVELLRAIFPPGWTVDDDTCRRIVEPMHGHPNAIRLTATQLANRSPSDVDALRRIYDDPAAELAAGRRRQQGAGTSRADIGSALQVGYSLLGEDERLGLRLIGVLNKPAFALWMLAGMLDGDDARAGRIADRLLISGFLSRTSSDSVGVPVFEVSDDVLQFARAQFEEDSRPQDRARLERRYEHRSAQRNGSDVRAATLAAMAHLAAGSLTQALSTSRWAVELARDVREREPGGESLALATLAEIRAELGACESARDLAEAALAGATPSAVAAMRARRCLALLARRRDDDTSSRALLEQVVDGANAAEPDEAEELVSALRDLAVLESRRPSAPAAPVAGHGTVAQAFRVSDTLGDRAPALQASLHWAQSYILQKAGRMDESEAVLRRAEQWAMRRAQRLWLAWIAHRRASLLLDWYGHDDEALRQSRDALRAFTRMDHRFGKAHAAQLLGDIHLRAAGRAGGPAADGQRRRAVMRWQEAADDFSACGDLRAAAKVATRLAGSAVPAVAARARLAEV